MRFFLLVAFAVAACSQETAKTPPAPETQPPLEMRVAEMSVALTRATPTGAGEAIGTVRIQNSIEGAMFELDLRGLPQGTHGFHIHEVANCGPVHENGQPAPAGAAGGHFDPLNTGRHDSPEGDGHLGDLPRLEIGADGRPAQHQLIAPRIVDIAQLSGHALMIHEGGDTYSDQPAPLGGGGARIACGVIG